jgi:Tfp pilus assembly protein PilW
LWRTSAASVSEPWQAVGVGPHRKLNKDERGFSLVDMLVGTAIAVVVLTMAIMMARDLERAYAAQMDDAGAREEAQYAVDWIEQMLRSAGSNPYTIGTSPCPTAGTLFQPIRLDPNLNLVNDDIRLNSDVNPPNGRLGGAAGACTESNEDVTIAYDAQNRTITLRDNNTGGGQSLPMTDTLITGLLYTYLDSNRVVTTNPNAIAFVRIAVTAQSRTRDPRTRQFPTYTVTGEVRVRAR